MALAHYYRILGLRTGASFGDVKLAYRNLARLYHPDINPGDQLAKDKFIQVTQAYRALVEALPNVLPTRSGPSSTSSSPRPEGPRPVQTPISSHGPVGVKPTASRSQPLSRNWFLALRMLPLRIKSLSARALSNCGGFSAASGFPGLWPWWKVWPIVFPATQRCASGMPLPTTVGAMT
ncbi:MAG: J domain-containing protein [Leptolyngbyaceae cyanobacterium SM2_3_12]|nr:J domain-containing protein [Leptolyngbyaceae cyanobacterium SM2_3_12]